MTREKKLARMRRFCAGVKACDVCPVAVSPERDRFTCPFAQVGRDVVPTFGAWSGPSDWARADAALARLDAEWPAKLDAPADLTAELDALRAILSRVRDDTLADEVAGASFPYNSRRTAIDRYRRAILGEEGA